MAVGGIGAVHDRIDQISSQISAIEHRNPLNRAQSALAGGHGAAPARATTSSNAFQQHLATQTLQTLSGGQGAPAGAASGGGAGHNQLGMAGTALATLGQTLGARTALGSTGLAGGIGMAGAGLGAGASGGAAVQALAALLQAGAQSQSSSPFGVGQVPGALQGQGIPDGSLTTRAQPQVGLPLAGAAAVQGQPVASSVRPGAADPLTGGIAALPKGTHPAIPERRGSKVPAELKGFGNGKIPADQLESVGVKDHQLWSPAAKAFKLMRAAAQRDGIQIGVNSSYRDVACQQCMVDKYGLYGQGGRAAPPGKSNHGWGLSIDLQLDDAAKKWMRANAKHYGFVEDVAREPWHWTFIADGDSVQANAQALLR